MSETTDGKPDRSVRVVWLLVGVICLLTAATSITFLVLSGQVEGDTDIGLPIYASLIVMGWAVVGGLILARYPRHVIGRLLLAVSGLQLIQFSFFTLPPILVQLGRLHPDDFIVRFFTWTGLWTWVLFALIPGIFLPLFFPTGALPSRRWRIVPAAGVVGLVTAVLSLAVGPGEEPFTNPFVIPGGDVIAGILEAIGIPTLFPAILASLVSMVVRYRRAGTTERQQMKWLFLPLGVFIIWLIYDLLLPTILPQAIGQTGSEVAFTLIGFTIPVAIGIAILRYRLYDIDLIIRKTLVYGMVTAALALVYFGSVVLLQQLTVGVTGQRSPAVIVVSTLLIAALFSPLRRRVQELVDRRFYRAKYDMAQTLTGFARTARDETDLEALTVELLSVVQTTMQPENVGVWLRPVERNGTVFGSGGHDPAHPGARKEA